MTAKFTPVTPEQFKRVASDINGNPRYALPYAALLLASEQNQAGAYRVATLRANAQGGRKYDTKENPDSLVFQSYSLGHTCQCINDLLARL